MDLWWAVEEVNVHSAYLCSQAATRQMTKQKSGRIIDIGSVIGANPNPDAAPYAVSKAALFRWNSCLADADEIISRNLQALTLNMYNPLL